MKNKSGDGSTRTQRYDFNQIVRIQLACRNLESLALGRYLAVPDTADQIVSHILTSIRLIEKDIRDYSGPVVCDPGYCPLNGQCQPCQITPAGRSGKRPGAVTTRRAQA